MCVWCVCVCAYQFRHLSLHVLPHFPTNSYLWNTLFHAWPPNHLIWCPYFPLLCSQLSYFWSLTHCPLHWLVCPSLTLQNHHQMFSQEVWPFCIQRRPYYSPLVSTWTVWWPWWQGFAFNSLFSGVLNCHALMKIVCVKKNCAPWISRFIRKEMDKRKLLGRFLGSKSSSAWNELKCQRNLVVGLQRKAKINYFQHLISKNTSPATLWAL